MKQSSFKKLNYDNWLEVDLIVSTFKTPLPNDKFRTTTQKEWFNKVHHTKLIESVPQEVYELVEVARGTMTYGYFFYPIFSFAAEQFSRIAETALTRKCRILNAPRSLKNFVNKIQWLSENSESFPKNKWTSIRNLRNSFSHPSKPTIVTPFMAIDLMNKVIIEINSLFKT